MSQTMQPGELSVSLLAGAGASPRYLEMSQISASSEVTALGGVAPMIKYKMNVN